MFSVSIKENKFPPFRILEEGIYSVTISAVLRRGKDTPIETLGLDLLNQYPLRKCEDPQEFIVLDGEIPYLQVEPKGIYGVFINQFKKDFPEVYTLCRFTCGNSYIYRPIVSATKFPLAILDSLIPDPILGSRVGDLV